MGRFMEWFFKGRIEKVAAKQKTIEVLSEEYDKGEILTVQNFDVKKVDTKHSHLQAQDWIDDG